MANVNIEQLTKDGNIIYPVTSFEAVRDEEGRHIGTIIDSRVDDRVDLIFQDTGSSFAGTASYAITASYALNGSGGTVETASYAEHSDWSGISGKPTSAVTDIDDAVTKKHSHSNISLLDSLTEAKTGSWDSAEANAKAYTTEVSESIDSTIYTMGGTIEGAWGVASEALSSASVAQQTADSKWTYNENTIKGVKVTSATAADSADTCTGNAATATIATNAAMSAGTAEDSCIPSVAGGRLFYCNAHTAAGAAGSDGYIYGIANSANSTYVVQLYADLDPTDILQVRSRQSTGTYWTSWKTIYHSGNCNNSSTPWNASTVTLAGAATMQYDSTNECIKFVFA